MLGGPMPRPLLTSVREDPAALNVLCTSLASRALWGNETFWADYRRRFDFTVARPFYYWADWVRDPAHQVRMLLVPKP
jgi:hypothetical protein